MVLPSLIIFGPQTTWPTSEYLVQLRAVLLLEPRLRTFLLAIKELPDFWQGLVDHDPRLSKLQGLKHFRDLREWIEHGNFSSTSGVPPNILSMPFTVVIQLVQYFHYLDNGISHAQVLESVRLGGAQGFCTGILTAFAVACSKNEEDVNVHGGIALRLAVCIGAYVDLDGCSANGTCESSSLAVRWKSAAGHDRVLEVLRNYPDAYISVIRDSTDVNITTPKAVATALTQHLSAREMTVKSTGLEGRYHSAIHREAVLKISALCNSRLDLQFPTADNLQVPVRSNTDAQVITQGVLHEHALLSILVDLANWHLTITAAASQLINTKSQTVVSFGLVESIPSSVVRESGLKVIKMKTLNLFPSKLIGSESAPSSGAITPAFSSAQDGPYGDNAIAVVGMACKFPGADSLNEFWQLLAAGTSMVREMPAERFANEGLRRSPDGKLRFWGNFVRDADAFDHRFFKKSSREAASMDPQQRLLLQVAYEAMESSGYFGQLPASFPNDIGCYLGVCASDYNDNVASHPPNAFSSLGTLRAFLSGKISHFFGWTGPSVTYDTACSSSAVAIHAACKAIATGECSQALAGGVSLYTSPYFYQNLAAASFLSPTGPTKPFDAKADGYCRGEGVGLVLLKRLSAALTDGDMVLGVVAGSAVNQNSNVTSITVPYSPSQIDLYKKVASLAGIDATDVSYVEAHGTGTPVGDPIEFESIRQVFGGSRRATSLHVASVKGNIGHLEGASGVAALIKTLLMMQKKTIPVQANFVSLNPKIPALEPDRMVIPSSTQKWDTDFQVACINNYGAAGSNAAMIVCEPPPGTSTVRNLERGRGAFLSKYPIFISANSAVSLMAYCGALREYCSQLTTGALSEDRFASLAFNLAVKQNRSFSHVLTTTAANIDELSDRLAIGASGKSPFQMQIDSNKKPVVLVFGGQVSNTIGLNKELYDASNLLRSHLNRCDTLLRSFRLKGLYPEIFQTNPIEDIVQLHSILFSLQYSSSLSWIDSGLQVDAVIGHSFGQLTALCVSGSLSLEDGLKLVTGRASLMQKHWGPECGSMISLEADISTILDLISSINTDGTGHAIEIACYNGPTSHVLVGTASSIQALQETLKDQSSVQKSIKSKKLNITHGFHSLFTEPLLPDLTKLAGALTFHEPSIPLETCSNDRSWTRATPQLIAEHTRTPVYFGQAVARIVHRLGSCTWLEAGSGSSVTGMVRRALHPSHSASHIFQSVQLSAAGAAGFLADTTVNLWKYGHRVQFWPFDRSQRLDYIPINLPPYQFEKARHWLSWTENSGAPVSIGSSELDSEPTLLSFVSFRDQRHLEAEFRVDPRSHGYKLYVQGHAVLAEPLCPAPLYIELVSQAAMVLTSESNPLVYLPCVEDLEIRAPLGMGIDRDIKILLQKKEVSAHIWMFEMTSQLRGGDSKAADSPVSHATGSVSLRAENSELLSDFSRYERLVGYHRFDDLMNDPDCEAMRGSMVYKVFAKVVLYADFYKGVRGVYSKNREVAGTVTLPPHKEFTLKNTITKPLAIDNFVQVAGLHVNSLNELGAKEVFVCTKIDRIQLTSKFRNPDTDTQSWVVYSNFSPTGEKELVNDIFVFNPTSKSLELMVLGAHFSKVFISSLTRVLSRANAAGRGAASSTMDASLPAPSMPVRALPDGGPVLLAATNSLTPKSGPETSSRSGERLTTPGIDADLRKLLSKVTDVPADDFKNESTLEELGVDSLMITEVQSEVCKHFEIDIPVLDFQRLLDVKTLRDYLVSRGCDSRESVSARDLSSDGANDLFDSAPLFTAPTLVTSTPVPQGNVVTQLAKLVTTHLETTSTINQKTNLAAEGLDSLLCIELANDIKHLFGAVVDMSQLDNDSTFGDLSAIVLSQQKSTAPVSKDGAQNTPSAPIAISQTSVSSASSSTTASGDTSASLVRAQEAFEGIRYDYDNFTKQTGFAGFWKLVYPLQARLVLAYTVEAFATLGCRLASLRTGQRLPRVQFLPKHELLIAQLHNILKDASLVDPDGLDLVRSEKPVDSTPSGSILIETLRAFPQHASEHKLLHVTGSKLAECLTGAADPLQLLFRSKENKALLEDVYTNGPMYEAITKLLGSFLDKAYTSRTGGGKIHILELGGGTGGTTKYIVDFLTRQGVPFTYTFTDISGSLVATARKKFANYNNMDFMILDIEKSPSESLSNHYHTVISTNCIHATKNLERSMTNIRMMLRDDGFVSLVEFTKNIFWFDLVFGLLDGWWLYEDGRTHVLADEWFWEKSMRAAGFKHITWTDGGSEEARTLRIIAGFPNNPENDSLQPVKVTQKPEIFTETVLYKEVGKTLLHADIYYPSESSQAKRPVALMIHGGGHCLFTRKEVDRKQTKLLLDNGFLPVSVDYRLCPEVNLIEGPMSDVCDALRWARYQLPSIELQCPGLRIDGERVAAVGWSTGGTLAMSLAFTAPQQHLRPPEAILAFYCPSDYEADWWKQPIYPQASVSSPTEPYDLLEGVEDQPITSHYPATNKRVPGMLMSLTDRRWRFILHMNWKSQTLPILLNGLPNKKRLSRADAQPYYNQKIPSQEEIASISPYAQIVRGNYRTPTYLIHGTADDMIPWQQSQKVYDALIRHGVPAGMYRLEGAEHLFDTFGTDRLGGGWEAIQAGFAFLFVHV